MKQIKIVLHLLILCSSLVGCSNNKIMNIETPYTVAIGKDTISYYDERSSIKGEYSDVTVGTKKITFAELYFSQKGEFEIFYNNDNIIRSFVITNEKVTTMHGIHVGDNISKVEENFEYEDEMKQIGKTYSILFNGQTETNDYKNAQDGWIWINYFYNDDNIIEKITISDYVFAKYLR